MSAQAGIWNFDGKPVDQGVLAKFDSALKQYGPDATNAFLEGPVGVVYRAFHTTRESHLEHQPHNSSRGDIFTWDGRLDNRDELTTLLCGYISTDSTDLSIVTTAFERWDTDCFRQFVGDWAVSIWRPREREVLFAVDYMAVRHIFYYPKDDHLWWSTDLAPLVLLSGETFPVVDDYIAGFLANAPDAHLTPYQGIFQVPPGHFVRAQPGKTRVERYSKGKPYSRIRYKSDREYEEHFRQIFRQSVRSRLRSDSPVLGELSGGLDSSSIVCVADDILANEIGLAPRLDTLSIYDKTEPDGDDWVYFPKIEEERGRIGVHLDSSMPGSFLSSLNDAGFSALPGYSHTAGKLAAERSAAMHAGGYRVVLSGIGGDEFMGGIPDPAPQLADAILKCEFLTLAKQLMAWSLFKRRPWIQLLWQASMEFLPARVAQHLLKRALVAPWIQKPFAQRTRLAMRQLGGSEPIGSWFPSRRSTIGGILMMANRMAKFMPPSPSLGEPRYPYLDQRLIEFTLCIPPEQLLRPGERRSLMRRALAGIVPQQILARPTKQFAARTPVVALVKDREELRAQFESAISSRCGYIHPKIFLETLDAATQGSEINVVRMLKTIALESWLHDAVVRGVLSARPPENATRRPDVPWAWISKRFPPFSLGACPRIHLWFC